jgi:hypothetical protein
MSPRLAVAGMDAKEDEEFQAGLRRELAEIQQEAQKHERWHSRAHKWWGRANYVLGLPATALAGVAALAGLANLTGKVAAGFIALASAVLSGVYAFAGPNTQRDNEAIKVRGWLKLATDAQRHLDLDLPVAAWRQQAGRQTIEVLYDVLANLREGNIKKLESYKWQTTSASDLRPN